MKDHHENEPVAAVVGIEYEEFKPETFKCVFVQVGSDLGRTTFTGHPLSAYRSALQYAEEVAGTVIILSSVDNFCSDVDKALAEQNDG